MKIKIGTLSWRFILVLFLFHCYISPDLWLRSSQYYIIALAVVPDISSSASHVQTLPCWYTHAHPSVHQFSQVLHPQSPTHLLCQRQGWLGCSLQNLSDVKQTSVQCTCTCMHISILWRKKNKEKQNKIPLLTYCTCAGLLTFTQMWYNKCAS